MKKISGELYTPFQKNLTHFTGNIFGNDFKQIRKKEWTKFGGTVNKVRASEGYPINTFRDLVNEVARVTIRNSSFEMFYRGQSMDYMNNQAAIYKDRTQKSIIFPTICRPEKKENGTYKYSVRKSTISERYKKMYALIDFINNKNNRNYEDEYLISLFQHYEICPTPFIDLTQSLRVAATFALHSNNKGYVFVFGLPFPNQSISYYRDLNIIILKLQNIVQVEALRPRYQEGYLVGKFPFSDTKTMGDDLSNRMIAKFYVDNSNNTFWDEYFTPIPQEILFPNNDKLEGDLKELKADFEKIYNAKEA